MAAGNEESIANGVTGVGDIEVQAREFCDSGLDRKSTRLGFPPALTGHSAIATFPAAISCSLLSHMADSKTLLE